jgi:hypothetical protein
LEQLRNLIDYTPDHAQMSLFCFSLFRQQAPLFSPRKPSSVFKANFHQNSFLVAFDLSATNISPKFALYILLPKRVPHHAIFMPLKPHCCSSKQNVTSILKIEAIEARKTS